MSLFFRNVSTFLNFAGICRPCLLSQRIGLLLQNACKQLQRNWGEFIIGGGYKILHFPIVIFNHSVFSCSLLCSLKKHSAVLISKTSLVIESIIFIVSLSVSFILSHISNIPDVVYITMQLLVLCKSLIGLWNKLDLYSHSNGYDLLSHCFDYLWRVLSFTWR